MSPSCENDCELFTRNLSCCLRGDCPRGYDIIIDPHPRDHVFDYYNRSHVFT